MILLTISLPLLDRDDEDEHANEDDMDLQDEREPGVTFYLIPGTAAQHFQHVTPAGNLIIGS